MTALQVDEILIPATVVPASERGAPHVNVPARLYRPAHTHRPPGSVPSAAVVWAHGGGFVAGNLDMPEADGVARFFAAAGHVVISVDYRLVDVDEPWSETFQEHAKHRFPAAHDDLFTAWQWCIEHASAWGVDPHRMVLGGASAGGNLAAGVALRLARTPGASMPCGLLLAYPLLHHALPEHDADVSKAVSALPLDKRFSPRLVAALNLNYVGSSEVLGNPYAFPGGHDLSGLPRTIIVNSEKDDLRSSGELFARELAAAGVEVTCSVEPGAVHGHLDTPELPFAERTMRTFTSWLAQIGSS